ALAPAARANATRSRAGACSRPPVSVAARATQTPHEDARTRGGQSPLVAYPRPQSRAWGIVGGASKHQSRTSVPPCLRGKIASTQSLLTPASRRGSGAALEGAARRGAAVEAGELAVAGGVELH